MSVLDDNDDRSLPAASWAAKAGAQDGSVVEPFAEAEVLDARPDSEWQIFQRRRHSCTGSAKVRKLPDGRGCHWQGESYLCRGESDHVTRAAMLADWTQQVKYQIQSRMKSDSADSGFEVVVEGETTTACRQVAPRQVASRIPLLMWL